MDAPGNGTSSVGQDGSVTSWGRLLVSKVAATWTGWMDVGSFRATKRSPAFAGLLFGKMGYKLRDY